MNGRPGGQDSESVTWVMQGRRFSAHHPIQPKDHIDVRPLFYPIQGWCEIFVKHDP